jgi:anthranilate synthase component 1
MKKINITVKTVSRAADLDTPVGLYLKIRDISAGSSLLESSDYHARDGAVSLIGFEPLASISVKDGVITVTYPDLSVERTPVEKRDDVVDAIRDFVDTFSFEGEGLVAGDSLMGFCAYDAVRYFEKVDITLNAEEMSHVDDLRYVFYRFIIRVEHTTNRMTVIENMAPGMESLMDRVLERLDSHASNQFRFKAMDDITSTVTDEQYMDMVREGVKHCLRGDVFQIVLARRFSQGFEGDEFNVYRALRSVNPSPYLFYFDMGSFKIFGSSPETHLRVTPDAAYIDPIAGTFRRTGDDAADRRLAQDLLNDPKENAEHIMLVDLARNDLSRSGGTVSIDFLKQVQFYSHVIHLVSRVKAKLPDNTDIIRLFGDTFPAGTLSGAPKVRALQLIDQIEPHNRRAYGGSIGLIGFDHTLNQAITIRSFVSTGQRLYTQAGAGITARSVPENELRETNNKLGALVNAVRLASEY